MPQRVASAELIVVGRVVAIEDQDVRSQSRPNSPFDAIYRVAVVQANEIIKGGTKTKLIRVGFLAPKKPKPGQPQISSSPRYTTQLKIGQEGALFLKKHFKESFYVAPMYFDFINSVNNKSFDPQIKQLKQIVALGKNPMAGLRSKDAEERLLAAAILVAQYRTYPSPEQRPVKLIPAGAEESRLILEALLNADWSKPRTYTQISPLQVFAQLGIGKQDGFQPPAKIRTPNDYPNAVRQWLKANSETYRIKRFVTVNSSK